MSEKTRLRLRRLAVLCAVAVAAAGGWHYRGRILRPAAYDPPPLAPVPFRNAAPDVAYVGISRCAECHPEQHGSYRQTAHSDAFGDVDLDDEPPDGEFDHPPSGRHYRIYRKDGALHHQEWMRRGPGDELLLCDHPVKNVVGSGRHTRSYLVEIDGFAFESPVTWYRSRNAWDMSPGYDRPMHRGFERPITAGCLICHVGRVEAVGNSIQKLRIHEQAIGCERCHGPGQLHAEARGAGSLAAGEPDDTIVHPGRLDRAAAESICGQCHLSGQADIDVRGRTLADFRPGRLLSDFREFYQVASESGEMTVVGHMEQMRQSACYKASSTLTCTTCHDPHAEPAPGSRFELFRGKCLECHAESACGEPLEERKRKTGRDDCVSCHMPRGDTEIPHIAFTHHRIGIHPGRVAPEPATLEELAPIEPARGLSELDRQRALGLAYLEFARKQTNENLFRAAMDKGRKLLEGVHERGLRDGTTEAALAQVASEQGRLDEALLHAQLALEDPDLPPSGNDAALWAVGQALMQQDRPAEAEPWLARLCEVRFDSEFWYTLARAQYRQNRLDDALKSVEKAAAVNAWRIDVQETLARLHHELGHDDLAERLMQRVKRMHELRPETLK